MDFLRRLNFPLPRTLDVGSFLVTSACGCFRSLGSVFGSALVAAIDARCVERAAHDVVAHTGQILHTSTANEHNRVLLEVMALARDVGGDLEAIGEAHTRNFAQVRVGLLWGGGVYGSADAWLFGTRF